VVIRQGAESARFEEGAEVNGLAYNRLLLKSLLAGSKKFFDPAYQRRDSSPDLSGFAKICWQKARSHIL